MYFQDSPEASRGDSPSREHEYYGTPGYHSSAQAPDSYDSIENSSEVASSDPYGQYYGYAQPTAYPHGSSSTYASYPGSSSYAVAEPKTPDYQSPSPWNTHLYKKPGPKDPKVSPSVLSTLPANINSFTFINGQHLGASPSALPHYQWLRGILQNIENGPAHINLLESPGNKHDMTLLITDHMPSAAVERNYTRRYVDISKGKKMMYQSVLHFDPTVGYITHSGHFCSPLITLYHELIHSCQHLLLSAKLITQDFLDEEVDGYPNRWEQLATEHANTLAAHLGQGQRYRYTDPTCYYKVGNFASPTPVNQEVVRAIGDYRNNLINWNQLVKTLHKHF